MRALLPDECFRLQDHGDEVQRTVEELAPGQGQRKAGLAGRGVLTVIAAEVARRVAEAVGQGASDPEDRCEGGKPRHTTANLRVGERGAAVLQEAEVELFRGRWASDCWKRHVHAGRTKAKDTAERMAKADFQLLR